MLHSQTRLWTGVAQNSDGFDRTEVWGLARLAHRQAPCRAPKTVGCWGKCWGGASVQVTNPKPWKGFSTTASRAGMVRRSAEVSCAARTSLEALGQGHGEPPAHGGD